MDIKDKIRTRSELSLMCQKWRREGKKIGFTSGSFDLVHAGHATYMEEAKKKCDVLIVGVNSDVSVKKYKGKSRPIIPENERVILIASLAPVDYAFLFDERRNSANIESLKPDYYIKAGDHTKSMLTSKEVVEKYGGKAVLIPLATKTSSSDIIDKILDTFGTESERTVEENKAAHIARKDTKNHKAVFLDRDGVINEDIGYLSEPEKFSFLPNALEGLKRLQGMLFKLVVVTNQPGIGLGYFDKEDFYRVNLSMLEGLSRNNIFIDKIYFCPHSKSEECSCRKPGTALLERAAKDINLDIEGSYLIGDKESDVEAGKRFGCKTILVSPTGQKNTEADYVAKDLLDAAGFILQEDRKL